MFNSTHTLVGLALARTGLDRWTPNATWTAVIASNLPDIDIAAQFAGTATYLDYHRGFTHSLAGVPILSLVLAAVMASTPGTARSGRFWKHLAVAFVAMATHPLLDWLNSYGMRPFLPFSGRWYYGDTLFIIDPYLDVLLLAGILIGYRWTKRRRVIAAITLTLAVGYISGLLMLRSIAQRDFDRYAAGLSGVSKSAVCPQFLNPFEWTALIETATDVSSVTIDTRTGEIQPQSRMPKAPPSDVTIAAESTNAGRVFRGFTRFPVTRVEENASGYRVLFIDVRFFRAPGTTALAAEILLDRNLRVQHESLSFIQPID